MGEVEPLEDPSITSGICKSCYDSYSPQWLSRNFDQYLPEDEVAACVFNKDLRILAVTPRFNAIFAGRRKDVRGLLCGEVLCCYYSTSQCQVSCGETEHCSSCKIRDAINGVFQTGKSRPHLQVAFEKEHGEHKLTVSLQKKEDIVLLVLYETQECLI
jgi:hypothetical protein